MIILSSLHRQGKSVTYYALDVSPAELTHSLKRLKKQYPSGSIIQCHGLLGTYDDGVAWLSRQSKEAVSALTILWLGNSIGNFSPKAASAGLERFCCVGKQLELQFIVGVDSCRDLGLMSRGYDPTKGRTRTFLLNGLSHANEILNVPCFSDNGWTCSGSYDPTEKSWKQYYVAKTRTELGLGSSCICVDAGEQVLAIRSAKWSESDVCRISKAAGLKVGAIWRTDNHDYGMSPFVIVRELRKFVR